MAPANTTAGSKRLRYLVVLTAVAAAATWFAWPPALAVAVAAVRPAPVRVVVYEPAQARLRDRYTVSAPLAGVLVEMKARAGDVVQPGQAVAVLVPHRAAYVEPGQRDDVQAALDRAQRRLAMAEADVSSAESQRTRVRADAQRAEVLYAQRLVDRAQVETGHAGAISADAALRAAIAQRDAARAQEEAARAVLVLQDSGDDSGRLDLAAPAEGTVLRTSVRAGDAVQAGQVLLEIGSHGAIEVLADVLTTHALHLSPGADVRLTGWGNAGELAARVRRVEPNGFSVVDDRGMREQRVTVVADLDPVSASRARLAEGARLQARFAIDAGADAVGVPPAALLRDGARWAVYVVSGGRARLRHVELGPVGHDLAAVYTGLSAGDRVVLDPADRVHDGVRVRTLR